MDTAFAKMIDRVLERMTTDELNKLAEHAYHRLGELGASESELAEIRSKYGLNERGGLYD